MRAMYGLILIGGVVLNTPITFGQPPGSAFPGPPFPGSPEDHILMLIDHFMEFDSNQDGKVSKTEAKGFPPFLAKFEQADKNKDGAVTREELATFLKKNIANIRRGPRGQGTPDGMDGRGPSGRVGTGESGQSTLGKVLPESAQIKLKLTAAQKKKVKELQMIVDAKIAHILTEEQEQQLEEMKQSSATLPESDRSNVVDTPAVDRPPFTAKSSDPKVP